MKLKAVVLLISVGLCAQSALAEGLNLLDIMLSLPPVKDDLHTANTLPTNTTTAIGAANDAASGLTVECSRVENRNKSSCITSKPSQAKP